MLSRGFTSVPMQYEFIAKATGSKPLSGVLEIHSKKMIFVTAEKIIDSKKSNVVETSFWNTFMTIYVAVGCDMEITVSKYQATYLKRIFGLVVILVLVAVGLVLLN